MKFDVSLNPSGQTMAAALFGHTDTPNGVPPDLTVWVKMLEGWLDGTYGMAPPYDGIVDDIIGDAKALAQKSPPPIPIVVRIEVRGGVRVTVAPSNTTAAQDYFRLRQLQIQAAMAAAPPIKPHIPRGTASPFTEKRLVGPPKPPLEGWDDDPLAD